MTEQGKKHEVVATTAPVPGHMEIVVQMGILGSAFMKAAEETCQQLGNQFYKQPAEDGSGFHVGQTSGDASRHLRFSPDEDGGPLQPDMRYPRIVLSIHQWPYDGELASRGTAEYALIQFRHRLGNHLVATEHER